MTKAKKKKTEPTIDTGEPPLKARGGVSPKRVPVISGPFPKTLTKQSFKDDCDVNLIVQRHATNRIPLPQVNPEDFGNGLAPDFTTAMMQIADANSRFAELPAKVRAHFDHNPAKFLDAVSDATRRPELEKLGLISPLQQIEPPEGSQGVSGDPAPEPPPAERPPEGTSPGEKNAV
jgi:hypothetical protein